MINPLNGILEFHHPKPPKNINEICEILNENFCPIQSTLSIDEKVKLVSEVGEEILKESELVDIFTRKKMPIVYDGFEPSGRMHIAQGILRAINVNKFVKAGCIFVFWIADWFAQMNEKMGGDLEKIKIVGRYFIEVWKAAGMDLRNVKFIWASEEINKHSDKYWQSVINIARKNSLDRLTRCCQIMGRDDKSLSGAQIMYPCMQCTDIFFLGSDITSLGLDQRKVNVLGREFCDDIKKEFKPVIISHHMLKGLVKDPEKDEPLKMSKSNPDSAIYMEDSEEDIKRKIKKGYCPPTVDNNPMFDYIKFIILPKYNKFVLIRDEKYGGNKTYNTYEEIVDDYLSKKLDPNDLKINIARIINMIIQPVRDHFNNDPQAKKIIEMVRSFKVTR